MAALAGITLASCNEFVMLEEGRGYLSVGLQSDDYVQSKAPADPAEGQIFSLDIYRGEATEPTVQYPDHTQIPASIELVADTYRLVAYSGTEQSAAWDAPFYRGETQIKVRPNQTSTAEIVCTVNNVVVSVEFDDVFKELISDYSVTVDNGESSLVFNPETVDRTAYFGVTGTLNWTLQFTNKDGKAYTTTGSYTDVKAAQHYKLSFSVKNPEEVVTGEAGIKITVDNSRNPAQDFTAELFFGLTDYPNIMTNAEFDISGPVVFPAGDITPKILTALANSGIARFVIRQRADVAPESDFSMWYDLVEASPAKIAEINTAGIVASSVSYGAKSATMNITDYVAKLPMGDYILETAVYDIKGHMTEKVINIKVQSGVDAIAYSAASDLNSARITALWYGDTKPAGLGFEYRKAGDTEWIAVDASAISYDDATKIYSTFLTGLEVFTKYEYRPYSDNDKDLDSKPFSTQKVEAVSAVPWGRFAIVTGKCHETSNTSNIGFESRKKGTEGWTKAERSVVKYDSSTDMFEGEIWSLAPVSDYEFRAVSDDVATEPLTVREVTTKTASTVYNLSFDDWHLDGKVWYPFAKGGQHVWDSANKGAANLIGSSTTPEENDVVKGRAVRMESKYAVMAFAAGNLYTGEFGELAGVGATLKWGIPFDSSPLALKGYYKYSPKTIDRVGDGMGMDSYKGQMDKMQIQIFLTDWTGPFQINTSDKKFVDFNAEYVLAYGKLESDIAYDKYHEFTIPLEYRDLSRKPTYIVISACGSYLGDYFTGGEGSVLHVDEFSLEYDPANLTAEEREKVNYR